MIVRSLDDVAGTMRTVEWGNGSSRRLLLERDKLGFTVTDTIVGAGTSSILQYRSHMEACYCIEGEGWVEADGERRALAPGTLYALDHNDEHVLHASTRMRLVCVFLPALEGDELHDFDSDDDRPSSY